MTTGYNGMLSFDTSNLKIKLHKWKIKLPTMRCSSCGRFTACNETAIVYNMDIDYMETVYYLCKKCSKGTK